MKNLSLSLALGVSIILGCTIALADTSTKTSGQTIQTMSVQGGKTDEKKGLDEALVVSDGKDSWILHQPMERYPHYFDSMVDKKMADEPSKEQDHQQS